MSVNRVFDIDNTHDDFEVGRYVVMLADTRSAVVDAEYWTIEGHTLYLYRSDCVCAFFRMADVVGFVLAPEVGGN